MHGVGKVDYLERLTTVWIGCCVAALLLFTLRLYSFAHFWLDDFNNLHWVRPKSMTEMLWYVVNPASDFFRPVGMFFYWIGLQLFDQNAAAYHWFLWSLHTINVGLVYWILRRFTNSTFGAAVGTMLFASQHVFNDVYWSLLIWKILRWSRCWMRCFIRLVCSTQSKVTVSPSHALDEKSQPVSRRAQGSQASNAARDVDGLDSRFHFHRDAR
jgi:hypothetical protein